MNNLIKKILNLFIPQVELTSLLYLIRVSVVIQAFCPAQTSVSVDRKVDRNPLLHIASIVSRKLRKPKCHQKREFVYNNP
jgi:hypothetical protein